MDSFNKLVEFFKQFPGTGPRQARRFAYFLLAQDKETLSRFSKEIETLKDSVSQCPDCFLYFTRKNGPLCAVCSASSTDRKTLMIVEKDVDQEALRKSDTYKGLYFILGGLLPILEKDPAEKIRIRELVARIKKLSENGLTEIIIALSANPEGENTAEYVRRTIAPLAPKVKITTLGRGLSTGTELEYSDSDTLSHALKNRG